MRFKHHGAKMTNSTQKKPGNCPVLEGISLLGNKVDVDSPASTSNSERQRLIRQCPITGKCGSSARSCGIALPIINPLPTLPNISRSFIASPKAMQSRNDKPKCWVSTVNAAPLLQPTGSASRQSVAEKHKCARSPNASYSWICKRVNRRDRHRSRSW